MTRPVRPSRQAANRLPTCVLSIVLLLTAASAAMAQTEVDDTSDQTDLIDVWNRIRDKPPRGEPDQGRTITWAPIVARNPTFGLTFGVAAQLTFLRGERATTRLSSCISSFSYSTKDQLLFAARCSAFGRDNSWFVESDNRLFLSGQTVYGLGSATPPSAGVASEYDFLRLHEKYYRQVAPNVYVGGGFLFDTHKSVQPADVDQAAWLESPYVQYSLTNRLPLQSQQSAGASVNFLVDKRRGEIDPRGGWMGSAAYRLSFDKFLGADSSWQALHLEWRSYVPLPGRRHPRLAIWLTGDAASREDVPYFDLPATVNDTYARSSRGYQEGRYRGERMVYGEVEYRTPLTRNGLIGAVAFANVTTVTNLRNGEQLFESAAPAAGGGLRVLLNKHSRTNICVDVGWGKNGAKGVYFALQDAF